jgi:hypothetical protein
VAFGAPSKTILLDLSGTDAGIGAAGIPEPELCANSPTSDFTCANFGPTRSTNPSAAAKKRRLSVVSV